MHSFLLIVASLLSLASAKICKPVTIPVDIEVRNGVFNITAPQSNLDVTLFAQNSARQGRNYSDVILTGYATVKKSIVIAGMYCTPNKGTSSKNAGTVQVLTHGIGFDKGYWDLTFDKSKYSYVDTAVDTYGYSTLALDRFGISQSTHGDPISEVQAPAELAALVAVTLKLKAGGISCIPAPQKVVHVGHSFGSLLTFALISFFPTVSDGAILTGFSGATQFLPITLAGWDFVSAAANQPLRFGSASPSILNKIVNLKASVAELVKFDLLDLVAAPAKGEKQTPLPSGYLTWGNLGANQFTFLTPPFYDPAFATVLEQTKQPVTMGELLTIGAAPPFGAQEFAGPVLVLTGQFDQIFCGGDCLATGNASIPNIPGEVAPAFPKAKPFQTYIQPNSGHAVNVHFNSTGAYKVINEFLGKNL